MFTICFATGPIADGLLQSDNQRILPREKQIRNWRKKLLQVIIIIMIIMIIMINIVIKIMIIILQEFASSWTSSWTCTNESPTSGLTMLVVDIPSGYIMLQVKQYYCDKKSSEFFFKANQIVFCSTMFSKGERVYFFSSKISLSLSQNISAKFDLKAWNDWEISLGNVTFISIHL